MSMAEEVHHVPSLKRSKYFATLALIIVVVLWIALMVADRFLPEYTDFIHILMLGAEAGVVGGLADWYAITVLFRNPFGKLPIPKFYGTIPRLFRVTRHGLQSRWAVLYRKISFRLKWSKKLRKTDLSLAIGQWLASPQNNTQVVQLIQQTVPKIFEFVSQEQIANFVQNNSVQWVRNTQVNKLASEMLRAVLENDFHQDVLQRGLDIAHEWVVQNPDKTRELTRKMFKALGVWSLARGASWIGIDVQQRTIDSLVEKVESMLADHEHPWRQEIETIAHSLMLELAKPDSVASQRLNSGKDALLDSPQVLNFISGAVTILCDAIKEDLMKEDSGIAMNLRAAIQQLGENLVQNVKVREVLNKEMTGLAMNFTDQYSHKIIRYVSERIHEWDSREMIGKIENEVGGDLHMIRVNGVVVGAFIGLTLGVIRAVIESIL